MVQVAAGGAHSLFLTKSGAVRLDCGSGIVRYEKCLICNHLLVWNVPAMFFVLDS